MTKECFDGWRAALILVTQAQSLEQQPLVYSVRLLAFVVMIRGILAKNSAPGAR